MTKRGNARCPAPTERVENSVACVGGGEDYALQQGLWLLSWVFAEGFLGLLRQGQMPDRAHLLVGHFDFVFGEIAVLHGFVIEDVFVFLGRARPDKCFVAGGEHAAGQIGGGIGFEPCNII